jgi:hypothetical protein
MGLCSWPTSTKSSKIWGRTWKVMVKKLNFSLMFLVYFINKVGIKWAIGFKGSDLEISILRL